MKTRDKERSWAFDNGGFLTGKQLFDILLLKDPEALKDLMENENSDVITKEELTGKYRSFLSRSITGITEEERERLIKQGTESGRDAGNLSTVIKSTDWEIRLGSCCKKRGEWCVEASLKEGNVKGLPFLTPSSREETERIIRVMTIKETGRELTGRNPEIRSEDFYACRPPKNDWGMIITGRKGRHNEEHRFWRN